MKKNKKINENGDVTTEVTLHEVNEEKPAKTKKRRVFDWILTAALITVIVVCAVNIAIILGRYKKANNVYDKMQLDFLVTKGEDGSPDPVGDPSDGNDVANDDPFTVDFKALREYNSDIIGWLYSENTPINYPVAQADDNDYYVRRSLDREYLITGTIFVDYRCGDVGDDDNYIIYGHHMRNGTIFGSLEKYVDQEYYDAHPTLLYFTPEKTYVIEVFAGFVTDTSDEIFDLNYGEDRRAELIENAIKKSGFETNVKVGEDDDIVTLCTCSYDFTDARFLLLGKIHEK